MNDEEFAREYYKGLTHDTISSGEFWGIKIGDSKESVLGQLKSLGIRLIVPKWAVRGIAPGQISTQEREALEGSDSWDFGHKNPQGFWEIELKFENAHLVLISITHSPHELL